MNKKDLVTLSAKDAGVTQKEAEKVVASVMKNIKEAIAKNESVVLLGFGTFSLKERPKRNGFNPITKKPIKIAARKVVKFKPSSAILS